MKDMEEKIILLIEDNPDDEAKRWTTSSERDLMLGAI